VLILLIKKNQSNTKKCKTFFGYNLCVLFHPLNELKKNEQAWSSWNKSVKQSWDEYNDISKNQQLDYISGD
jgi:hypothetical protein